jgi:hypothetical protein
MIAKPRASRPASAPPRSPATVEKRDQVGLLAEAATKSLARCKPLDPERAGQGFATRILPAVIHF